MRTNFSLAQLADPDLADAEKNLRACVHCGICTATCPTYVLTGDERDGPRGRIVMMQAMLEANAVPSPETVRHLDRCLSCLGCRTACPSGVNYPRLIDTARAHIETHYPRPLGERVLRWLIARVLTRPELSRATLTLAKLSAPLHFLLPGRLRVVAQKGAAMRIGRSHAPSLLASAEEKRIALMPGCVQKALAPEIDEAVARLLSRRNFTLTPLDGAGCCGSLVHHLGREDDARSWAKRAIEAFEISGGDFEAVLITATGCSLHLKNLAHLFADDPQWRNRAARFAAKVKDFSELVSPRGVESPRRLRVAYHAPCSLQHGLRVSSLNETLLTAAGFEVLAIPEGHLCCGSAGSYSILQPELADALRVRKLENIATLEPDVIATANIGCLEQLSGGTPIVHVAELLDWAEGGPKPAALHQIARN
ncbi:MAG TPA: glycolate oxidase subunit GlcF [Rhizomicrobium sp.]|jgi:glycolate oxidase iron-sulfur subunit